MRKIEPSTIGITLLWVIVILILLAMNGKAAAQGIPAPIVTTFAADCYTVTEDTLTAYFGYSSNGVEHFIGSGYDITTQAGEYPDSYSVTVNRFPEPAFPYIALGRMVEYDDPALAGFNGVTGAPVAIDFDLNTLPNCQPEAPVDEFQAPVVEQPVSQVVMSTGRTCTIQYPKIILVCNG